MSLEDELYDDALAQERELPNDEKLRTLSDLASQVRRKDEEIQRLNDELKQAKQDRQALVERDIPETMHELGMERFQLTDGTSVEIRPEVYAGIPEHKREDALRWLRENGFGDLIKQTMTVQFGMGEDEQARSMANELLNDGYNFTQKTTVLPQTLKAWVREQDARGQPVPEELFNVHRTTVAKLKEPK